jgi:predicted dienelactone hydrolase
VHRRLISLCLTVAALPLTAQHRVDAPREDGGTTPLLVYEASGTTSACAPLAVISHGVGGDETGYGYLAQGMARLGYTAIVMGHRESGPTALRSSIRDRGLVPGIVALVADPYAEGARLQDVGAALAWAGHRCHAPFRVLLGHSMGAETVMLEAGARDSILLRPGLSNRSRFDAYVALSPEGPGIVFPRDAWTAINKPILFMTGTNDKSLKGGVAARLVPWSNVPGLPSHCQWLGVIDGATHFNFDGSGPGHERVEAIVTGTLASFLQGARANRCALPASVPGLTLQAK